MNSNAVNPFKQKNERNSFPSIDCVWETEEGMPSHDDSQSQHSQSTNPSLNLSIGARAALYEHMRHVEKYGIDGEVEYEDLKGAGSGTGGNGSRNQLDDHWDKLMDGTSPFKSADCSRDFSLVQRDRSRCDPNTSTMTDDADDFFNSSRIFLLATPEKNKKGRLEMVGERNDGINPFDSEESEESGLDQTQSSPSNLFSSPEFLRTNLSNSMTPNDSMNSDDKMINISSIEQSELSLIEMSMTSGTHSVSSLFPSSNKNSSSSRRRFKQGRRNDSLHDITNSGLLHSSFGSASCNSPLRTSGASGSSTLLATPRKASSRRSMNGGAMQRRFHKVKPSTSPNVSPITNRTPTSTFHRPVGNPMTDYQYSRQGKNLEASVGSTVSIFDTFAVDILRAIEGSQVNSPNFTQPKKLQLAPQTCDTRDSINIALPHPKRQKGGPTSISIFPATDRRRYRTVVPQRVFLDSSPSSFPVEDDSFTVDQGNMDQEQYGGHLPKSLFGSFEAVAKDV